MPYLYTIKQQQTHTPMTFLESIPAPVLGLAFGAVLAGLAFLTSLKNA